MPLEKPLTLWKDNEKSEIEKNVKQQVELLKTELLLSELWYKLKETKRKGKYTLIIQIEKNLTNSQLKSLKKLKKILKERNNTNLSYLLNPELNIIGIPLWNIIPLAKFIKKLIEDSKGEDIYIKEKWFLSSSTTFKKNYPTKDFVTKDNSLWWIEELSNIIWIWKEKTIITFINNYNKNRNSILSWINEHN